MSDRHARKEIADGTIGATKTGFLFNYYTQQTFDLRPKILDMMQRTSCYLPGDRKLSQWRDRTTQTLRGSPTTFAFLAKTTLQGARHLEAQARDGRIGILNFASATKPGGGFRSGAQAQEESIARSSTLFKSLESQVARPFYSTHRNDENRGFYTDMMIWSPGVLIFRDDQGGWVHPLEVDVVTSPAVNAKVVRGRLPRGTSLENEIEVAMHERMGKILALFERKHTTDLVLGSFGTGVFKNDVGMVAEIWRQLLYDPGARFEHSFRSVVFAIPDYKTLQVVQNAFTQRHAGRPRWMQVPGRSRPP
ncbi:hypothetical protein FA15DRAFT_297980 [Coprinopsis marcescibilis]|uniref:Microbial-type PARG catalytic domain-containing protein n=1 Tax=Coprinopsis marcescibilis TaxID=230819 RepID=A0A5C3L0S2_COPMA|nr:hypothetical protein FA15DRAFT_297980 [Coprinopsis marcescibilis]